MNTFKFLPIVMALTFLVSSCSLMGLGSLSTATCESDDDCKILDQDLPEGSCLNHSCDLSSGFCVQTPLDRDGDGESSIECGGTDCDDRDELRGATQEEICGNAVDEDCDGEANDLDCDGEDDQLRGGTDCDDNDARINSQSTEVCNGIDDDCNGLLDGPDEDDDGDGYADSCAGSEAMDCDDGDPAVFMGADELCDGFDNDCIVDGLERISSDPVVEIDEDRDGDGHSAVDAPCIESTYLKDDCDDSDPTVYAGAQELCDGKDNDCDGTDDNVPGSTTIGSICVPPVLEAGSAASCALTRDHRVICWGDVFLGDTRVTEDAAVIIPGLSGVEEVQLGQNFGCARLENGEIHCFGPSYMLVGISVEQDTEVVGRVLGIEGAVDLAASSEYACVLESDDEVWCWGYSPFGSQFGAPTNTDYSRSPILISVSDVAEVETGGAGACVRTNGGEIHCWGANFTGILGRSPLEFGDRLADSPVAIEGIDDAQELEMGGIACVIRSDGSVWCWGGCSFDDCGRQTPAQIPGINSPEMLAVGGNFACVITAERTLMCWGDNSHGQAGSGGVDSPGPVEGLTNVSWVTAGSTHACAVADEGAFCWGQPNNYRLGTGQRSASSPLPGPISVIAHPTDIVLGHRPCFLMPDRSFRCLATGIDAMGDPLAPVFQNYATSVQRASLSTGENLDFTCHIDWDGNSRCNWDSLGALIECHGTVNLNEGDLADPADISVSGTHACAVHQDGGVSCWGCQTHGQLGVTNDEVDCPQMRFCRAPDPIRLTGIEGAEEIVTGTLHSCVLLDTGRVICWGDNTNGQVGSPPYGITSGPRLVAGLPADDRVVQISAKSDTTCAVTESNRLFCWGILHGIAPDGLDPTPIDDFPNIEEVAVGTNNVCLRLTTGGVRCWGSNTEGQLGDGTSASSSTPVVVDGLSDAERIACGTRQCCAVRTSGQAVCWGEETINLGADAVRGNSNRPRSVVDLNRYQDNIDWP